MDEAEVNPIGFRVAWSERDEKDRIFQCRHYMAGEQGDPSLNWCLNAAEGTVKKWNDQGLTIADVERPDRSELVKHRDEGFVEEGE